MDAILAAAAEVVAEHGVAGATMHAVAKKAKTSVGSMYHFFPDRESLLSALAERHGVAIREINRQLVHLPAATWRQYSVAAAIEALVTPYVAYLRLNPDALLLRHGRNSLEDDADFMRTIRSVLDARLPTLAVPERENAAAMLHAIAAGVMHIGLRMDPQRAGLYLREIPHALTLYLAAVEAAAPR